MNNANKAILTEGSIALTLIRLSLPVFLGILSIVALNLIDTFFVGYLGEMQLAALSFTFPVMMVLGSIGMGIGVGASAVISRAVGEGDFRKTQRLTTDSIILSSICAFAFALLGLSTITPFFEFLGAEPEVLVYIKDYMYIWYMSVICIMATFIANNAIRAKGDTKTPAYIMMGMVLINIILDPILIFGWGIMPALGMKGAALATLLARIFSLTCSLYILHFREKLVSLVFPELREMFLSWKEILKIGLPASATNLIIPITATIVTKEVATYGQEAIAALGVVSRIDVFAITPIVALANVLGPFIGQNIGAKKWTRVGTGIQQSQLFSLLWGAIMLFCMYMVGEYIAPLFNKNEDVVNIIILYLSIAPFGYSARCLYIIGNMALNVLNKPLIASSITILQMFAIYIPLVFAGGYFYGLSGIFGGMALAYLFGGGATFIMIRWVLQQKIPASPKNSSKKKELLAA